MKTRLLLLLLFAPISMLLAAQTNNPHLAFMGIPIDGKLNSFVDKVKDKGFTVKNSSDKQVVLSGEFASYKDCLVFLNAISSRDLVNKVSVALPYTDNWLTLSSRYESLKLLLMKKYGNYIKCTEEFQTEIEKKDLTDYLKMSFAGLGMCKYVTYFLTSKGSITLGIAKGGVMEATVLLVYADNKNSELEDEKAIEDL